MTKQDILKLQKDNLIQFEFEVRQNLANIAHAKRIIAELKRNISYLQKEIKKDESIKKK